MLSVLSQGQSQTVVIVGFFWEFFFGLFTVVFSVSDSSSSQRSYRFVALGCHQGQETNIWCPVWQVCVRTCVWAVC